MPEMLDSRFALISEVVSLTFFEDSESFLRDRIVTKIVSGTKIKTITASSILICKRRMNEPIKVKIEIKKSSGPWCASSVISKRSVVARLISFPVLFLS